MEALAKRPGGNSEPGSAASQENARRHEQVPADPGCAATSGRQCAIRIKRGEREWASSRGDGHAFCGCWGGLLEGHVAGAVELEEGAAVCSCCELAKKMKPSSLGQTQGLGRPKRFILCPRCAQLHSVCVTTALRPAEKSGVAPNLNGVACCWNSLLLEQHAWSHRQEGNSRGSGLSETTMLRGHVGSWS